MRSEEIAARFDNRPGFSVVDYMEIGLPIYRLTCTALMQVQKRYPPIEEFVLRCLAIGLREPIEVTGMLGLTRRVVEATLTNLIRSDDVFECHDGSIELTEKGKESAREHVVTRPVDQSIVFFVDGLTRRPQWFDQGELLFPKQAEAAGLKQIRAFPARRPNTNELDITDVFEALRVGARAQEANRQLLRIKKVTRADRTFMPALLLIFKRDRGHDVQVAFVIDGRLSDDHEMAFLEAKGLQKLRIRELVVRQEKNHLPGLVGERIAEEIAREEERSLRIAEKARRQGAVARLRASIAEGKIQNVVGDEERSSVEQERSGAISEIRDADKDLKKLAVRPLAVYEHPELLRHSISTVRERLVIISPWITPAVVSREFLKQLELTLERGIRIYVGYGLGEDSNRKEKDNTAIEGLQRLDRQHVGFTLKRFGDTHAKILIKDREFFVTSSFNWLSFRGDPNRTFREEFGTFVGIPEIVEEFFDTIIRRFG